MTMNKTFLTNAPTSKWARGVTLVELMIALTLGTILLIGVVQVFTSNQHTFRINDNVGRLQENARTALDFIGRDVRAAGGMSCLRIPRDELAQLAAGRLQTESGSIRVIADPPPPGGLALGEEIRGFDAGAYPVMGAGGDVVVAGTDGFRIGRLDDCGATLAGNLGPRNANIQLGMSATACNFQQQQVLVITDCENTDIFRVTNSPNPNGPVTLAHGIGSNTDNNLTKSYDETAFVAAHIARGYYISIRNGRRALMIDMGDGPNNPVLAENVENMQILYGVDQTGDLSADAFVNAGAVADWSRVVAAQINLLMASDPASNLIPAPQTYAWLADAALAPANVVAGDRRIYRTFSQTITLRNRAP
jgi:type IV pilus assembly protein PilW